MYALFVGACRYAAEHAARAVVEAACELTDAEWDHIENVYCKMCEMHSDGRVKHHEAFTTTIHAVLAAVRERAAVESGTQEIRKGLHMSIYETMATAAHHEGMVLQCGVCLKQEPITREHFAEYLASGWPKCCGRTMILVTGRETDT